MAENTRASGLIADTGIELLTFGTPNGTKASILLEELKQAYGMDYTYQSIDIFQNVQKEPWYTALAPNGRIPVIIDHDKGGHAVMEGITILNYLVRSYDHKHEFWFEDPLEMSTAEQWVAWQHGQLGPMQAQTNYYYRFYENRYAFPTQRFFGETEHLYGVLNTRLANRDYIAGNEQGKYSIADMAIFPFVNAAAVGGIELEKFPNVYGWWKRVYERPAVRKALSIPSGTEFPFGIAQVQQMAKDDPKGVEEREGPLRDALKKAQEEFGYIHKSV